MPKPKARITIADVAREADVSMMTVSRVLNNKGGMSEGTRQHVHNVMRELGYKPNRIARSLATSKTLKIGVIVPSISSAYFGSILEGAEHIFWEKGYHILLCNTPAGAQREQAVLDLFEEDRVDGIMILSSQISAEQLSTYLRKQRAAVVINSDVLPGAASLIHTDEYRAMAMAVEHLVNSGRRCLGYVGSNSPNYAGRERQKSYVSVCQDMGLKVDADHMLMCDRGYGRLTARQLLQQAPEIDGLVCYNDEIAAGALRACLEMGRHVPDDVAVVGYDDIFLAELLTPSLTTLRLKMTKREVGATAARLLLERIDGSATCDELVLEHELVVRESAP